MKDIRMLKSVQKFACKVCLKCWDMYYDNMLHCLNLPCLSERRQYLKLQYSQCITLSMVISFFQKCYLHTAYVILSTFIFFFNWVCVILIWHKVY